MRRGRSSRALRCTVKHARFTATAIQGQINGTRLEDLAHVQRRKKWISATDLLTDDAAAFGTTLDHTLLAYAEGWLLVYYLMKTPVRLPQFQAYLKTISRRTDKNHRYDDAEKHFGDLDRLDQDLRREAIRLQRERLSHGPWFVANRQQASRRTSF